MSNPVNEQTGLALAYWGYTPPADPNQQAIKLPTGWEVQDLSSKLGADWNVQKNASGTTIENQFQVIVNRDENQIGISFKGSDTASNWGSDIANAGAAEYDNIKQKAQAALDALRADPNYAGYSFFDAGHSLGGGMAQSFAVKNGLDAYVYNSLPIANGTINGGYYGVDGFAAALAKWKADGRMAYDIRTPNDIATFFYSSTSAGIYLSNDPKILPGVALPDSVKAGLLASILANVAIGAVGLAVMGIDHTIGALRDASTGLGMDSQGRYIIPQGADIFATIPASIRSEWGVLSTSPVVNVTLNGGFWIIDRQDGSKQWAGVDNNGIATLGTFGDATGSTEISFNKLYPLDGMTIKHLNANGIIDQVRTIKTDSATGVRTDETRSLYPDSSVHVLTISITEANGTTTLSEIFDTAGNKVADTWTKPDGSYGSDSFNINGSNSGIAYNRDGSSSSFTNDGAGNIQTTTYTPAGVVTQTYTSDGQGNIQTTNYTPTGVIASHFWKNENGSRGSEVFKADGSVSGTYVKADGSYQRYADDGKGNRVVIDYAHDGEMTSNRWWKADGSHGVETVNPDRSHLGTAYAPDGSYANSTQDASGNTTRSVYDAQNKFLSSDWRHTDGSYGYSRILAAGDNNVGASEVGSTKVFTADGKGGSSQIIYRLNGSVIGQFLNMTGPGVLGINDDGNSLRIETQYGPDGNGVVSNTVIRYNADGSGTSTTTDANGHVTEKYYGRGELKPYKKPDMPDGTPQFPEGPPESQPQIIPPLSKWPPSQPSGPSLEGPPDNGPQLPAHDPNPASSADDAPIDPATAKSYNAMAAYPQRSDPFTLDLDGDGIETTGINSTAPLMFDIDATGLKKSVGWIKSDDGLLALDRNGNGTIDSGAELFGDATTLTTGPNAGQKAADGFAALADLDSNADGQISSLDTRFANLRVWRDLNQDGISQSGELFTLAALGIASINIGKTEHSTTLTNGNVVADLGTYTRSDGSQASAGTAGQLADIDLAVDSFTSQFTDTLPISTEAQALPNMQGAGQVRTLREAATLSTSLATLLTQFSQAGTRAEQQGLLDQILKAWSDTSTMATTFTGAYAGHVLTVDMQGIWSPDDVHVGTPAYNAWADKLTILERFNGRTYQQIPSGFGAVNLTLYHGPRELLEQSYDALRTSVYENLVLQTRLKPLLDLIGLNITETGINLDFSQLNAELDARLAANPTAGLGDLMDFTIGTKEMLKDTGWVSTEKILNVIQTKSMGSEGESLFNDPGTRSFLFNEFGFQVKAGSSANETISGSNAAELILGFGGNDVLNGGVGNDTLEGGTGDDRLTGGDGNDTYIFRRGDGHDTIVEDSASSADTLILEGINPGDVSFDQSGYSLLIVLKDSGEYVNLQNFYLPDSRFQINVLKFADGTVWDRTTILAKEVNVFGGSGNDTIEARGNGPSTIYGYDGNDSITTTNTSGVSRVFGGAGNDTLSGYYGNDYFDGGAGDDRLTGNGGNDTYIYRRGDGHDTLIEDSASGADTLILEGINPTDITLEQTGYSLLIRIQGSDEWVNLQNFYLDTRFQIARIQFADGTVWDRSTILAKEVNRYGSSGNDTIEARSNGPSAIYGYDGNDSISSGSGVAKIFGGNGNDTLSGYLGNDYFDGGAGDDRLTGSSGNDTYIFRRGDGHDTIIEDGASGADTLILEGINPTDITLEQTGYSLLIRIQGSDEWVNLQNFYLDTRFQIASIQFANGTVWDRAAILAKEVNRYGGSGNDMIEGRSNGPSVIYGYDGNDSIGGGNDVDRVFGGNGNDTLTGFAGNDILDGGAGDDLLSGSGGNDTYVFRRGDGHDTIITNDYGPTDTLILEGINPGEIRLDQYGYSMFIVVKDTGEWVNVQNFYLGTFYQIGVTTQVHGMPRASDESWMNSPTLKS